MEMPQPTSENQWLMQLLGEWDFVHECNLGPDQPASKTIGTQVTRALGGFWILGDMEGPAPNGEVVRSIITIGYDSTKGKFVGSFVASCMNHLWIYEGSLDAERRVLTLDCEGPSFSGDGSMSPYQDIIEVFDANTYQLRSRFQTPDGSWVDFMQGNYTRKV